MDEKVKSFIQELENLEKDQTVGLEYFVKNTDVESLSEAKRVMEKVMERKPITSTPDFEYRLGRLK